MNKCYSQCISDISHIPVFNYFDVYKIYDNHQIEDLTYYKIELTEISNISGLNIIFNNVHNIVFGYVLKQLPNLKYTIQYYRRPSHIEDVNFSDNIDELYNNETIDMSMRKTIANITIGLLEKIQNKREIVKVFKTFDSANFYALQNKSVVHRIKTEGEKEMFDKHILGTNELQNIDTQKLYIVKVKNSRQLKTSLLPIKDMIYLNCRLKMFEAYNKLKTIANINIVGIKTDCILFNHNNINEVKNLFPINNKIGGFKIETNKYLVDKLITIN